MGERRTYRRETAYPEGLRVNVTAELKDAVQAVADAAELPVAAVVRDAITRGLPLVRDAHRRTSRHRKRHGGGS